MSGPLASSERRSKASPRSSGTTTAGNRSPTPMFAMRVFLSVARLVGAPCGCNIQEYLPELGNRQTAAQTDPTTPSSLGISSNLGQAYPGPSRNPGKRSPPSKGSPLLGGVFIALVLEFLEYLGRLAFGGFGRLIT